MVSGRRRSSQNLVERVGPAFHSLHGARNFAPGTLNLVLDESVLFKKSESLWRDWGTSFRAWPAELNGHSVFIVRWKRCRGHIVEVVADENLRTLLGLDDGGQVTLMVHDCLLEASNLWKKFWFLAFWYGRGDLFYRSELYPRVVGVLEVFLRVLQK